MGPSFTDEDVADGHVRDACFLADLGEIVGRPELEDGMDLSFGEFGFAAIFAATDIFKVGGSGEV